ncbi:hypothetical protein BS47DRAFT_1398306 [Hydnum rufescens UP504]|uniref:Endonuclease/exonuclease/phosphatase domain-containing protein n=1 Tax=Hydnum rufescens UP504 TaxID=1448309 RepID=A0A9P6DMB8_9AGAM|nr:hypothetical protein BS47DRAFT_1398306 [Hydnum rufescens UP504]
MAYQQVEANLDITLCTDLINDLDIMALDIKCNGSSHTATRIINIYNQPTAEDGEYAADHLQLLNQDLLTPTILMGDWNLHHPLWRDMEGAPSLRAWETVTWLGENSFSLLNACNQVTYQSFCGHFFTPLNLSFVNEAATVAGSINGWRIDADNHCGSDHFATIFSVGNDDMEMVDVMELKWNWKEANKMSFVQSLTDSLHADELEYERVFGPLRDHHITQATPEEVDQAAVSLQTYMSTVAEAAVPHHNPSKWAKPWWTRHLTVTWDKINLAHNASCKFFQLHGEVNDDLMQTIKHTRNLFDWVLKSEKKIFYLEKVEKATYQNFWDFRQWTSGSHQYPSPALSHGPGKLPAVLHKEKCDLLWNILFLDQPEIANDALPDMLPHNDDIPYEALKKGEV